MKFIVNRYCALCMVGITHTQTQYILGQQDDNINIQAVYTASTYRLCIQQPHKRTSLKQQDDFRLILLKKLENFNVLEILKIEISTA